MSKKINKLDEIRQRAEKLPILADWLDIKYPDDEHIEVQNDL